MTTNLKGCCFISYRRSYASDAVRLRDALRDRGVPTWRDLDDLQSAPTEAELRATLESDDTACAIMLITPDVADSTVIRKVEAPLIFKRARKDDGFFVLPVLLGVGYEETDHILGQPAGFQKLEGWNLCDNPSSALTDDHAAAFAKRVLTTRLSKLRDAAHARALEIEFYTRRMAPTLVTDLRCDFSFYFNGRTHLEGAFQKIEKALLSITAAVLGQDRSPSVAASGAASLPFGALAGAIFSPLAGFDVSWRQAFQGKPQADWSLSIPPAAIESRIETIYGDTGSNDLVLALSISADIEASVTNFLNDAGIRYRAAIVVSHGDGSVPQGTALSPEEGLAIILKAVGAARDAREAMGLTQPTLHLFLACPLAMAFLIGQKLNTFGRVMLYEHTAGGSTPYIPVHDFNPSDLKYS